MVSEQENLLKLVQGTVSKTKHEILFSRFGINYNTLPERYRKGSILVREEVGTSHKLALFALLIWLGLS